MFDVTVIWEGLSSNQRDRLHAYADALLDWNARVNLVSRRTTRAQLLERHVLHSLALHARPFAPGSTVVDWGTGGGLPGLVLALVQPHTEFVLVDSIRKKTVALQGMARDLKADNVTVWNGRAEAWDGQAHYAVSRATAPLADLWGWSSRALIPFYTPAGAWAAGLWALKGRGLQAELDTVRNVTGVKVEEYALAAPFEDKAIVSVRQVGN